MTLILIFGSVGNVLTILVLRCPEHKKKNITLLMINLAIADIIIIVFGYPVVVASNYTSSGLGYKLHMVGTESTGGLADAAFCCQLKRTLEFK